MSSKKPKLYSLRDVAQAAKRAPRTVQEDRREPGCPLRWTHKVRREVHTTREVLEAYLRWIEERAVRPIESAP